MSASPQSVRAALRDAVRLRDCLALAVVPAAALAVFALPPGTRESLAFAYRDPTLATAYAAHFVHFEFDHLAANLLGYALLAGFGYVLAALAGCRRLFGAAAATYVLAFPLALSGLNLAVPRDAIGYGLSGVNMAFAGLLGLVLVAYASRFDRRIRVRDAPGVFFAAVAVVSLVALPGGRVAFALAATSALLALAYAVSARTAWRSAPASQPDVGSGWVDVGVLGAVAFLGYPFVGFPAPSPVEGTVVNVYAHLLGFCLGFLVPYVAFVAGVFDADAGFLTD
ncbi:uncharacterized protein HHUB_3538 [Halobacterium hubeiense]|uniref:Rhomboid family protease n=1 Tax=Halobacterium hubeiense TaxID=1407499 RepID=A0A0U5HX79_9EURY|nr:hypothetical protein [Halobacterium hubeiense]CQH61761.1 uncharacterized protein HHUB_3538 [Halobacterium hubeiense]